jgi:GNAT superfamily N-acetyltransferase
MKIREAEKFDSNTIARLSAQLGYPVEPTQVEISLQEIHLDEAQSILVFENDDKKVSGWIHVYKTTRVFMVPFAEIGGLVVDEAHRNGGIGRKLLVAAEEWASEHGCNQVLIRSRDSRERAHLFYMHSGYESDKKQNVFRKKI